MAETTCFARRPWAILPLGLAIACGTKIDPVQVMDVPVPSGQTTWCRDVKPVFDKWCVACHASSLGGAARSGAPAGLDFDTYAGASEHASAARDSIARGSMPPGGGVPAADLGRIVAWIDQGKPDCPEPTGDLATSTDVPIAVDPGPGDVPAPSDPGASSAAVTWCRDLRPILEASCTSCHATTKTGAARAGAPVGVDYDTYAATVQSADRGNIRVQAGTMPPGSPLSAVQKATFQAWMDDGKQDCPPLAADASGPDIQVADIPAVDVPVVACSTGKHWTGGNEGDARMRPGRNCMTCHAQQRASGEEEAPRHATAGTVMAAISDEDDCYGASGVTVEITPTGGSVFQMVTNQTGNFMKAAGSVALGAGYKVRLVSGTKERVMYSAPTDPNCMNCHTRYGANGAPGRILAP